ncbi:hypothetical protein NUM_46160 [Actinocatenispora comari]|uniref:HTH cro/C1-type domain-containing protein n=2 Tax=Actinocatenispora comari TaxID=2807577 RepID=A0A8J4ELK8_9ACTN|nr:hypothetical protein NUM_46160 [Actinocatenispora comari]
MQELALRATVVGMAGLRDVGDFIREQRRSAQISLRQLAKQTGVSNPYLSQIERGLRKPSAEVLQQIANALRVSTPVMYLRAGLLEHSDGQGVLTAIAADEVLTARQKQSLAEIYEAFRRENLRYAKADAASPDGGAADAEPSGGEASDAEPSEVGTTPEPHDPGVGAAAGAGAKPAPAAEAPAVGTSVTAAGVTAEAGAGGTTAGAASRRTAPAADPIDAGRATAVPMARTAASAARRAASKAAQRAADGAARAAGSPAAKAAQRSAGKAAQRAADTAAGAAQRAADTAAGKAVRSAVGKRGRGRPDDQ